MGTGRKQLSGGHRLPGDEKSCYSQVKWRDDLRLTLVAGQAAPGGQEGERCTKGFVGAGTALPGPQLEMLVKTLPLGPGLLPWIVSKLSKAVFAVQTEACPLDLSVELFCSVSLWKNGTRHT